jgi:hypothetical protein
MTEVVTPSNEPLTDGQVNGMIVRRVEKIGRARTPREAIAATGRKQNVITVVADAMPRGEGDEATVFYFEPDKSAFDGDGGISPEKLALEYDRHGLKPDPRAVAADNEAHPDFGDKIPNVCQWQGADGDWYYVAFYVWYNKRVVCVYRVTGAWHGIWWFGGVRK